MRITALALCSSSGVNSRRLSYNSVYSSFTLSSHFSLGSRRSTSPSAEYNVLHTFARISRRPRDRASNERDACTTLIPALKDWPTRLVCLSHHSSCSTYFSPSISHHIHELYVPMVMVTSCSSRTAAGSGCAGARADSGLVRTKQHHLNSLTHPSCKSRVLVLRSSTKPPAVYYN